MSKTNVDNIIAKYITICLAIILLEERKRWIDKKKQKKTGHINYACMLAILALFSS